MTNILQSMNRWYQHILFEKQDPRTKDWAFTSPATIVIILTSYLYFCTKFGPRYMEGRKPYELRNVLIVYNILQVLFSLFLFVGGVYAGWWDQYSWTCAPIDYSNSPSALPMVHMTWYYYFAKLTELLDTVFFVLRKKDNQISFLHLYHHCVMAGFTWVGIRYFAGGHATLFGVINSLVHVVMYTYYLIAGLGPQYQKYLWWKKYLTVIQLVQFSVILVHNLIPLFNGCDYPKILNVLACINSMFFIYMFGKFYINSYMKKPKKALNDTNGHLKAKKEL